MRAMWMWQKAAVVLAVIMATGCGQDGPAATDPAAMPMAATPLDDTIETALPSRAPAVIDHASSIDDATLARSAGFARIQQAARRADASLGVQMLARSSGEVCTLDAARYRQAAPLDQALTRSLAELDAFRQRFCPPIVPPPMVDSPFEWIRQRAEAGDADAQLLDALLAADVDVPGDERDVLQQAALRMAGTTRSPYVFEWLHTELLGDAFLDPASIADRPFGLSDDALRTAWMYGALLASCERFGHCGAGSVMVMRLCMPHHCRPGLDGRGYVRDRLDADSYAEAERRARALGARQ